MKGNVGAGVPESGHLIDARPMLEALPVGLTHLAAFATLFGVQVFEGISQLIVAYAAAAMAHDLSLEPRALGLAFAVAVGCTALGAFLAGMIGDAIGPKRTALLALTGLGVATALVSAVGSLPELILLRAASGLCSGAGLVNVIALAAQYAPARRRASLVTLVVAGFPTGAMLTGLFMAALFPADEWRSAFIATGLVALAVVPLVAFVVPESIPVLLRRADGAARARKTLARFGIETGARPLDWGERLPRDRVALVALFRPDFLGTSLMVSAICIVHLVGVYFLSNWMPLLLQQSGASSGRALNLTAIFNAGGIFGVLLMGRLIDFVGTRRVLTGMFLTGAAALVFLAMNRPASSALYVPVLMIAGMAFLGGTGVLNALPSLLYPVTLRSTAGGWAIGTGHLGSAAGPLIGGLLLQGGWKPGETLMAASALPALAFILSMVLKIPAGSSGEDRHA